MHKQWYETEQIMHVNTNVRTVRTTTYRGESWIKLHKWS